MATPSIMSEEEEEDYGALIYRENQLRKAEAAAAAKDAKKKKSSTTTSNRGRRATTSSRKKSAAVTSKDVVDIRKGRLGQSQSEHYQQKTKRWLEKELNGERTIRSTERYVLLIGAQIKLRREECALSMGQRLNTNDAAVMDAQIKLS